MARRATPLELHAARSYPVVVLISAVDRRILPAVRFVSRLPFAQAHALHISFDAEETRRIANDWMRLDLSWLPLRIRDAGIGQDLATAVRGVLDDEDRRGGEPVTVVIPELSVSRWWHPLLHRQTARHIAAALQLSPSVTPVIVPLAWPDAPARG